ncbi:VOC family protein [Allosaccharopolyspora coralli]|uniref:VOC family protein n=1 Tax=Allosaccharopolyspora coralli TaxID=2665642 RepID=A0A5Q3QI96_9PSEU|nr:VOC family protein [Allosaccharopolyspora coralli]QGK70567.1 VOC family protein [Allosaccharopolyspora coralli]
MDEDVIPILPVEDVGVALQWYGLLGFTARRPPNGEGAASSVVEIARGDVRVLLSQHEDDAPGEALVYLRVRDVDAVAAEFGMSPETTPGAREIELRDPDGNRLRVGTPEA